MRVVRITVLAVLVLWETGLSEAGEGSILPVEAAITLKDPIITIAGCLRASEPGTCLKKRALRYIESWILSGDDDIDRNSEDDSEGQQLPPVLSRLVDSLAGSISRYYYGDDEEEEEDDDEGRKAKSLDPNHPTLDDKSTQLEEARGPKKKLHKAIRRALIKLVIIALLIKHKIKMLLTAAQTFFQFKFVMLVALYVITHIIKLWVELKHKHFPHKVHHFESAHHHYDDHHYDPHHDHHGWGGGIWGRSIAVTESGVPLTTVPTGTLSKHPADQAAAAYFPHQLAYNAQIPNN